MGFTPGLPGSAAWPVVAEHPAVATLADALEEQWRAIKAEVLAKRSGPPPDTTRQRARRARAHDSTRALTAPPFPMPLPRGRWGRPAGARGDGEPGGAVGGPRRRLQGRRAHRRLARPQGQTPPPHRTVPRGTALLRWGGGGREGSDGVGGSSSARMRRRRRRGR
jgi:hypothetical protein